MNVNISSDEAAPRGSLRQHLKACEEVLRGLRGGTSWLARRYFDAGEAVLRRW